MSDETKKTEKVVSRYHSVGDQWCLDCVICGEMFVAEKGMLAPVKFQGQDPDKQYVEVFSPCCGARVEDHGD